MIDIGASGKDSDGGIFKNSSIGIKLADNTMNVPEPQPLHSDIVSLTHVLVADEAFQLSEYILTPYSRKSFNFSHRIFNYRLSRARRIIESSFGILTQIWRILRRPLETNVQNAVKIVKATVCLHNWLQEIGSQKHTLNEEINTNKNAIKTSRTLKINLKYAHNVREEFCKYFNDPGRVSWQEAKCIPT